MNYNDTLTGIEQEEQLKQAEQHRLTHYPAAANRYIYIKFIKVKLINFVYEYNYVYLGCIYQVLKYTISVETTSYTGHCLINRVNVKLKLNCK